MKWHDRNNNQDKNVKALIAAWGLKGYGMYKYILTGDFYVADSVEIARETGMEQVEVEEIITYLISIGLTELYQVEGDK